MRYNPKVSVLVDHKTETFLIGNVVLDKDQAMSVSIAFMSMYSKHPYISRCGHVMDAWNYIVNVTKVQKEELELYESRVENE